MPEGLPSRKPALAVADLTSVAVDAYDAVFCDLDGSLISGDHALPGAVEFVADNRDRLWIVSNNSSDTAETLSIRLDRMNLPLAPERILLAGEQTVRRLARKKPGAAVAVYGGQPITALAADLGLLCDSPAPDIVLLARDTDFGFHDLTQLLEQLHFGAELLVTNLDRTHPGACGAPVPETGALLAAVQACKPDVDFRSIGKPDNTLITVALERAGVQRDRVVFIGDNLETDGRAARHAGIEFIQIRHVATLSGHDGPRRHPEADRQGERSGKETAAC